MSNKPFKDIHYLDKRPENINNDGIPDGVYFEVNLENRNMEVIEHHVLIND